MKYIRTKDGVYESEKVSHDDKYVYKYEVRPIWCVNQDQEEIINQADTIEELCDFFVKRSKEPGNDFLFMTKDANIAFDKKFERYRESFDVYDYYGVIETKWGIKYIAKLNREGRLELL